MPTCTPVFGIGVRHIQYFLFSIMLAIDYWQQSVTFNGLMVQRSNPVLRMGTRDGPPYYAAKYTEFTKISLFSSFAAGRLFSAFLVTRLSNKYFLVVIVLIEALLSSVYYWFLYQLSVLEFILYPSIVAFFRAFHWTFIVNILAKWTPAFEITTASMIVVLARDIGISVFTFHLSGMPYHKAKFFLLVVVFLYIVWVAVYILFGADGPGTSYLVSKQEINFLGKNVGPRKRLKCNAKTPWKKIFKNWFLYGWTIADFGRECAISTVSEGFRILMEGQMARTVYGFQSATALSSVIIVIIAVYTDRLLMREKITPSQARKIYSTVGCCGLSIAMILAAYVLDPSKKLMYLVLCTVFATVISCGQPICLFDLSPNYAAPTFAVFTFLRMLLFIAKTYLDGYILGDPDDRMASYAEKRFDLAFYRYGYLIFLTNLVFLMFGNIELKQYDSYETKDWRKESVLSYP